MNIKLKTTRFNSFSFVLILLSSIILSSCGSFLQTKHSGDMPLVKDDREVKQALSRALEALDQGENETADKEFQTMMALDAKAPNSLNHYAIFLREQWRLEEAETVYLKALEASPKDAMTHWNIGILYELYFGKFEKALAHYQRYSENATEENRKVKGWIGDLQRRINARKQEKAE